MAFLVMCFMDEPKRPVKKKLVHRPGNSFHNNDGEQDNNDWEDNSHRKMIAKKQRIKEASVFGRCFFYHLKFSDPKSCKSRKSYKF